MRPAPPRCTLARFLPESMDTEAIKEEGFREHGILVINLADSRLRVIERQVLESVGSRLYGKRQQQ